MMNYRAKVPALPHKEVCCLSHFYLEPFIEGSAILININYLLKSAQHAFPCIKYLNRLILMYKKISFPLHKNDI